MRDNDTKLIEEKYDKLCHEEHEAICTHCGECCRANVIQEGKIVALEEHCPAYDKEKKICTIYEDRFKMAWELYGVICASVEESIARQEHPEHCPYCPKGYKSICKY